jgi:hypothetical protein
MIADVKSFMNHDLSQLNTDALRVGWGPATQMKDDALLTKLCDYFAARMEKEPMFLSDTMWEGNVKRQQDVITLLQNRDIDGLHENLKNLFSSTITHGTTQGKEHTESLQRMDAATLKREHGLYVYDKLLDVLEYAGIVTAYSPEEYFWVKDFNVYFVEPDIHLEKLINKYQLDLTPPKNQGMLFGLDTIYGVYSIKDIHAIGLALIIKDKFKEHDPSTLKICEIGGGAGQFAYYMNKMGFTNYTIVDIPTISISQMYHLGSNGIDSVKFLSPDEFDGKYDIVINVDSMPEMSEQSAREYIGKIAANSKYFLSVNQERLKFTVSNLCSEHDSMIRLSRNLFWFRKGYLIEEFMHI